MRTFSLSILARFSNSRVYCLACPFLTSVVELYSETCTGHPYAHLNSGFHFPAENLYKKVNVTKVIQKSFKPLTPVCNSVDACGVRKLQNELAVFRRYPLAIRLAVTVNRKAPFSRHKRHVTLVRSTAQALTHGHSAQVSMIHECSGLVTISKGGVEHNGAVLTLVNTGARPYIIWRVNKNERTS